LSGSPKKYCLDTSGLSNPLEAMPEDVHSTLWKSVASVICAGKFAVTKEIYDELDGSKNLAMGAVF